MDRPAQGGEGELTIGVIINQKAVPSGEPLDGNDTVVDRAIPVMI